MLPVHRRTMLPARSALARPNAERAGSVVLRARSGGVGLRHIDEECMVFLKKVT